MTGKTSVFLIHGAGYRYDQSIKEAVEVRALLEAVRGLPPETLFIVFDWPSEGRKFDLIRTLNEDSRRSRIASYHLARFLQAAPERSRLCLMGHSDGGRVVLTSMHLLSGAALPSF
jgi:esterase/lipase superfamily enzyme